MCLLPTSDVKYQNVFLEQDNLMQAKVQPMLPLFLIRSILYYNEHSVVVLV